MNSFLSQQETLQLLKYVLHNLFLSYRIPEVEESQTPISFQI